MITTLILLTLLTATDESNSRLVLPPPSEFGLAPGMPWINPEIPRPTIGPGDCRCLPEEYAKALAEWSYYASRYPQDVCQPAIDEMAMSCRIWATEKQRASELDYEVALAASEVRAAERWPPWKAWVVAGGALVVGVLGGYLAGSLIAR